MDTLYQEIGRGKYHVEYESVNIEDAVNVVFTRAQLHEKYGTKEYKFAMTNLWYENSDTWLKVNDMVRDALQAFKDPKVKFFPVGLPHHAVPDYYWKDELKDLGLGYTMTKGGGFVPKIKPNYTVPNKGLIYNLKQAIAFRVMLNVQRTYGLDIEVKSSSTAHLNNIALFCKKLGHKKFPPLNLHAYNPQNGETREKLDDFIQDWLAHSHPKKNNPKMIKALAKEMRAWWTGAKEVAR